MVIERQRQSELEEWRSEMMGGKKSNVWTACHPAFWMGLEWLIGNL
jgi:hypothetical protein